LGYELNWQGEGRADNHVKGFPRVEFRRSSFRVLRPPVAIAAAKSLLLAACVILSLMAARNAAFADPQSQPLSVVAEADELLQEMSGITGLPIKTPLKKQLVNKSEIRKYLEENLHTESTPEERHIQEATLRAFGLVSPAFNLETFAVDFYTEQVAGFYDPRRKTMFIADWVDADAQKLVLAHELTHALQDQNFDLEKFVRPSRGNDDATSARQAVAEGHAMAAMVQRAMGPVELSSLPVLEPLMAGLVHQQHEDFPTFSNAPYFFRLQALFPYAQGMGFIQRVLQQGGWKKLNALFEKPPATTKEIFEPQVYFDSKALPTVSLPRPKALTNVPGLRLLDENTIGELGVYALLGQFISEEEAKTVGTGWLADRYILYEYEGSKPGRYVLVVRTRWSSAETALAFFRDYRTILAKRFPDLAPDARPGVNLFVGGIDASRVILVYRGDEVSWVEGIPAAQTDIMLDYLHAL
jgi:hypothetical protein